MSTISDEAMSILKRLCVNWTCSAKECRDMVERLGPQNAASNELLRDAAQYDQSIYGVGLAIAALRANAGGVK